jgi:tRNA dimethylallyltransferase
MVIKQEISPLLVIVGETASGKSQLAMRLAKRFDGEIIAVDSWTVYVNFDIGTAKPTTKDRSEIPHHLIDVAKPKEGFSAAVFKKLALRAIDDISSRGKLPILVGGAGLYIDSILFDYSFMPAPSTELRDKLNTLSLNELLDKADQMNLDIKGIDIRNKRRIIRLIENKGQLPKREAQRLNTLILGLKVPIDQLVTRITERVDTMFTKGLEQEVSWLAKSYGWEAEPMKGIGYREFYEYFENNQTLSETRNRIISATLALAKKQRTWFKRNKSIHWINEQVKAVDLVTTFLNK